MDTVFRSGSAAKPKPLANRPLKTAASTNCFAVFTITSKQKVDELALQV
jgi:hypothetical protein